MTIKERLNKIEETFGKVVEYKTYSPFEIAESDIKLCIQRYGFSEQETRSRIQHIIDRILSEPPIKIEVNENRCGMKEKEVDARIAELLDMEYLKYFTDTKNTDIPLKRARLG